MNIEVTHIKPYTKIENAAQGKLMAVCDILLNNFIEMKNLKIYNGKEGNLYVIFPQLTKDGSYEDVIAFSDPGKKKEIQDAVLKAYSSKMINGMYFDNDVHIEIELMNKESSSLKGRASVEIDGVKVLGIAIINGKNGLFVSMPTMKIKNPTSGEMEYKDLIYPSSAYQRELLGARILDEYERKLARTKTNEKTMPETEGKEPASQPPRTDMENER